ncbi:LLM class flavin-dependent oxidoreductase [Isoptericola sp. b441]|uniref:LLM class flavin-dependent oxidoreductase n=1 Tax=Actinotalea lenta TaxID=3064654 RepID=A0ABT9D7Z6_9CELL|nr:MULTISPECIES: LLM class flavin-dependent oxidoreductase [unclassified Isoptericola]MDO8106994.1 LLM class flavin-dependent oxidoreductase [Isoptericola sp. b441]MDO8121296.1 LLM class flavin-dependent oxidoreductase [Isoptericola sp. b490]
MGRRQDDGRDPRLGVFCTPSARDPGAVVDLAVRAERAGLDLVTFQDHPYQPAFLDTWTLLSWVGARTSRVMLAGNVLNLPLRPPAVLARAVASLDLLTGGRVALGLGTGAFWDAIAAMGGTRLSGPEAVTALEEALAVIRGLWDTESRGVLHAGGAHHRVDGAKRGPAPAHPVPVWLGAYGPRMLRITGRTADGWLPSLGHLSIDDLPAAQRAVDEAALAAGRQPTDVRRLLNVPAEAADPDTLARLVGELGVDTVVVATDDPAVVEALGALAPRLRDLR